MFVPAKGIVLPSQYSLYVAELGRLTRYGLHFRRRRMMKGRKSVETGSFAAQDSSLDRKTQCRWLNLRNKDIHRDREASLSVSMLKKIVFRVSFG